MELNELLVRAFNKFFYARQWTVSFIELQEAVNEQIPGRIITIEEARSVFPTYKEAGWTIQEEAGTFYISRNV